MADLRRVPLYPVTEVPTKDSISASAISGIPGDARRIPLYPPAEVLASASLSAAPLTGIPGDTRRIPLVAPAEAPTSYTLLGTDVAAGGVAPPVSTPGQISTDLSDPNSIGPRV